VRRFKELLQIWWVKDGKVPKGLQLYEQGLEEYPKADVAIGNVMMLLWIALGTLGCYFLYPAVAWVFLAFALAAVYIVLRKLVCTNCYYTMVKGAPRAWGRSQRSFSNRAT